MPAGIAKSVFDRLPLEARSAAASQGSWKIDELGRTGERQPVSLRRLDSANGEKGE